jgi:DNA-binding winged helix-turn-helix (wHTH) protein
MSSPTGTRPVSARKFRFGAFELDTAAGELRKHGVRLRLQEQPLKILEEIVARSGDVVSRDELVQKLWPDGTFVEFDRGLNAAINRLRRVLADSAENPRYIETVARRGYRFIAPVALVSDEVAAIGKAEEAILIPLDPAPAASPTRRGWWVLLAAGVAAVTVVASLAIGPALRPKSAAQPTLTRMTWDSGLTTDPALSPDGKMLAYASDRGATNLHIWIQQLAPRGQAIQLTHGESDDSQPAFSPDGSRIVFRSERDGGGIYVIPSLGGEPALVAARGRNPRFSPDGKWIAYWTGGILGLPFSANAGSVFLVPAEGGSPQILKSDLLEGGRPIWSPDSSRLLVFGRRTDDFTAEDWWTIPVTGGLATPTGVVQRLREKQQAAWVGLVPTAGAWIGSHVVFCAPLGDAVNLWKLHLDPRTWRATGPAERLTFGAGLEIQPNVTPDGRLVFAALTSDLNV